jgi:hypothetical protein
MISFKDADVIVQESIRAASPLSPIGAIDSNTPLQDLGLSSSGSLDVLRVVLKEAVSRAVSLDLPILFAIHTGMVVRDVIHTLQLSARKLCSHPTDPHEQPCCPYPSVCAECGWKVVG